jgi:hypothetical protein
LQRQVQIHQAGHPIDYKNEQDMRELHFWINKSLNGHADEFWNAKFELGSLGDLSRATKYNVTARVFEALREVWCIRGWLFCSGVGAVIYLRIKFSRGMRGEISRKGA